MLNTDADPRVYFAAERTFLAWLRTGITVMAFGFVVARFGLLLRLMRAQAGEVPGGSGLSPYLGAVLVLLGVIATAAGTRRYHKFCRRLGRSEMPSPHAELLPLLLGWSLVVLGVVLVGVLLA
jgi:putative membrane protein